MSIIKIENLSFSYPTSYDAVFENICFQIDTDWKLGLIGRNGRGKTTLLKLLLGQYEYSGRIIHSVTFDYFPYVVKDRSGLTLEVLEEICCAAEWELIRELSYLDVDDESLFKAILKKMGFERVQFEKRISEFSEGQKKKVQLAKSLCEQAHLYLWDEPLNFIDIDSRIQIEALIKDFSPTLLLVEHDCAFRESVATKTISL